MALEPFGFTVKKVTEDWDENPYDPPRWLVVLPHQCDWWSISGGDRNMPDDHEDAVAELKRFIAEAQNALAVLEAGQEQFDGDDWLDG